MLNGIEDEAKEEPDDEAGGEKVVQEFFLGDMKNHACLLVRTTMFASLADKINAISMPGVS